VGGGLRRDRRVWITRAVVAALLVGYVVILYLAAVLAGGALLGTRPGAGAALTVLAAAVAALTLEPLGGRLRRRLPELPQDRLTRLARGAVAADDLPEVLRSTARLVQEGIGAASVGITTAGTSALTARWPSQALLDETETAHITPLTRSGNPLGHLAVAMPAGVGVSPRDRALLADVGQHVATILQAAVLRDALHATVSEAELRAGDLRASRQRLVLASQQGRRRVERDIHDGAQQHLVALAVHLGLLRSLVEDRPRAPLAEPEAAAITTARTAAVSALAAVEELSHGLYPARLAELGLAVALEHAAGGGPLHITVRGRDVQRVDPDVEAAVYFCCLEAVQNAVKHARAHHVDVRLAVQGDALTFTVSDDGDGFAARRTGAEAGSGTGMRNMRDRLEALGGALDVASVPGAGTTVSGEVPFHGRRAGPGLPASHSAPPSAAGG
jgi:signal transduction histidine kinase